MDNSGDGNLGRDEIIDGYKKVLDEDISGEVD